VTAAGENEKEAQRNFTRRKLNWLDEIRMDRITSDFDFRIAHSIASFMDHKIGGARASQWEIAQRAGKSRRGVQHAIARIQASGYLTIGAQGAVPATRRSMRSDQKERTLMRLSRRRITGTKGARRVTKGRTAMLERAHLRAPLNTLNTEELPKGAQAPLGAPLSSECADSQKRTRAEARSPTDPESDDDGRESDEEIPF